IHRKIFNLSRRQNALHRRLLGINLYRRALYFDDGALLAERYLGIHCSSITDLDCDVLADSAETLRRHLYVVTARVQGTCTKRTRRVTGKASLLIRAQVGNQDLGSAYDGAAWVRHGTHNTPCTERGLSYKESG